MLNVPVSEPHPGEPCPRLLNFRRLFKFALGGVLALAVLLLACWWWRAPLLTGLAQLWIVSDPPAPADAIAILGGGVDTRPLAAAQLYREGWSQHILVLAPPVSVAAERGLAPSTITTTRRLLASEQVPEEAVAVVGQGVTSTWDEARALVSWAQEHQARRVLVPTDLFHTRRAGWILRRELQRVGTEVCLIPVNSRLYSATNWWQHHQGVVDFQNEVLKHVYYRLKY